jgi:FlaA1/EpsC-like NDP-sugar epimerase/lipopolysaccharide/colanic/teichoic acid biosynthesis glycosyltransferase
MGWNRAPRYTLLTLGYAALLQLACLFALLLRFDGVVPPFMWSATIDVAPAFTLLSLAGFLIAGLFHGLWRYAGTVTLFQIFKGVTLSALSLLVLLVFGPRTPFTASFVPLVWMCEMALMSGARIGWRLWRERALGPMVGTDATGPRAARALVIGAGSSGVHLTQEMRRGAAAQRRFTPVGFLDQDPRLTAKQIEGVKVLGTLAVLPRVLEEFGVEVVVISSPELPAASVREIARACDLAGVRVKTLAGLSDAEPARAALTRIRDVRIDDLLGRRPVKLDSSELASFLHGQRVLVTGAGGTIGAELARQAAAFAPAALGLLDHAENGVYYVQHELVALHPSLVLDAIVADIQDAPGIEEAFRRFRPTVVFHAAAHKHVPLLEANPREAVLNNVIGTLHLVQSAERHGVGKFVLISTDKAVRPSSVMGATKRVCEMLLQARAPQSRTRFVAVRFGNVLGSEGSVIPLFQRQLERGGPLTVTHPEARRYFMTVSEAALLVMQAGAMGRGGEVFLLDMGEQVRILDLARQLIRMAGLVEGVDVQIAYTGLRPGEKLVEELHTASENARMTRHERILTWDQAPLDEQRLLAQVRDLEAAAREGNGVAIRQHLRRIVPDYQVLPPGAGAAPATAVVELPVTARRGEVAALAGSAATASAQVPAGTRGSGGRRRRYGRMRRFSDATLAAVVLTLTAPLWPLLWLEAAVRGQDEWLEERVFVGRSRRSGGRGGSSRRGRPATSAAGVPPPDRHGGERRTLDLMGAPLRSLRFRSDRGPLSRWLARRGLDRLPELLSVVGGEMALVGPSPVPRAIVTLWTELVPEAGARFGVPPGVTGPAQLSGDSEEDVGALVRRAALDLDYLERGSMWLDFAILLRTAGRAIAPPPVAGRAAPREHAAPAPAPAKAVRRSTPPRPPRAGG